jgi:hypothetical protein
MLRERLRVVDLVDRSADSNRPPSSVLPEDRKTQGLVQGYPERLRSG